MIALTKWLALGAILSINGCTVTLDEGPLPSGGSGGEMNFGGSSGGGASGNAGTAGQAGNETGGSTGMSTTDAGIDSDAGTTTMSMFGTPTCDAETDDTACEQCLKQKCCGAWIACDDQLCFDEWSDIAECVTGTSDLDESSYGECVSTSVLMGFPETNTLEILACINEEELADAGTDDFTRCGTVCFGQDYLP